ncbi:hypothetical protein C1H76_8426 [Elsinoe australis]|uniref:ESCRT-II complex subunit VPS25 n=1 Tax=Elsinoe australis TaxID=40998 RepID=A0A4U7AWX9_9PEZI|nr:hypothetical protein C1H76_8426 [Elsinoe australis]
MESPLPAPTTSLTPQPTTLPAAQTPSSQPPTFTFPSHFSFPPFFTLQPNLTTLSRQLALWSTLIQTYTATQHIFRLSLSDAPSSPLFHNPSIARRLDLLSIRRVFDYMTSAEGDRRAEWVLPGSGSRKKVEASAIPNEQKNQVIVWWRRPEEWADAIYGWVDGTGQRGSVLTVYELRESEEVKGQEWVGMDEELFRRCLEVLVKRGKAQVFGEVEGAGVKFF